MKGGVVVAGSVAQKARQGGHTWQFLQYLLGLRHLGWDVLLLDRLEPDMCVDEQGVRCSWQRSANVRYLTAVMERFGLGDSYCLVCDGGQSHVGLTRTEMLARVRRSAMFLNVMGFIVDEEILGAAPYKVLLDTDPGFGQMWQDMGLHSLFEGHDRYVTIALNIGRPGCGIPTCGIDWVTTVQPVVLEEWPQQLPGGRHITGIGAWRGPYGPMEYRGHTYGLRVHEFRKFVELPRRTGASFELALDIHPAEEADLALLTSNGWRLVDPGPVTGDPDVYRRYIQGSRAELMVAKSMYVDTNSGWFSERSMCYLASGKPVLAQDTGLTGNYPLGEGLWSFRTLEEAEEGVRELERAYERHAAAAREVAAAYFDSRVVLPRLLSRLGVG